MAEELDAAIWLEVRPDRVLVIDQGTDVILCDRNIGNDLLLRLSPEAVKELRAQLDTKPRGGADKALSQNVRSWFEAEGCFQNETKPFANSNNLASKIY
jgi:hypothetical protein